MKIILIMKKTALLFSILFLALSCSYESEEECNMKELRKFDGPSSPSDNNVVYEYCASLNYED